MSPSRGAWIGALLCGAACKPLPASRLDDVVVGAFDGQRVRSVLYRVEDGKVTSYACTEQEVEAGLALTAPDRPAGPDWRELCKERRGEAVPVEAFERRLAAAYLAGYEDLALNAMEREILARLVREIGADPDAARPTRQVWFFDGPADVEMRFVGLFDVALGIKPPAVPATDRGGGPGKPILEHVLDTETVGATSLLELPVGRLAEAVDTLSFALARDGGRPCPVQVLGLAAAVIDTPEGPEIAQTTVVPGLVPAYRIPETRGISVVRLQVAPAGPRGKASCTLTIRGERLGGGPSAPAPALDERDLRMARLMGRRSHRAWHFLWHGIRGAWPFMAADEKWEIEEKLGKEWTRFAHDGELQAHAGEDFFYMHRMMLGMLKSHLKDEMYEPWSEPPRFNDERFPVPATVPRADAERSWEILREHHARLVDPANIRGRTLGAYAHDVEETLHNALHGHWSDWSRAAWEPTMPEMIAGSTASPEFDHPHNNHLGSTFTSHVHPYFWRLHGYIDGFVVRWLQANGYQRIAEDCGGDDKCYQWKDKWTGAIPRYPAEGMGLTDHEGHDHAGVPSIAAERLGRLDKKVFRLIRAHSVFVPREARR